MLSKLIWLSLLIALLYSVRSAVKCQKIDSSNGDDLLRKLHSRMRENKLDAPTDNGLVCLNATLLGRIEKTLARCRTSKDEKTDISPDRTLQILDNEPQFFKGKVQKDDEDQKDDKKDNKDKKENDSVIAKLDDFGVWPIQKKEIKKITCKGDHCDKIEFKEPEEGNVAYTFSLVNPLPDTLIASYNLVCRNITDNDKRKCIIELEVTEKEESKEGSKEEKRDQPDKGSKKNLPFIFGFLGAEILIVLALTIVFGLNGKGPLKQFLRPDRS